MRGMLTKLAMVAVGTGLLLPACGGEFLMYGPDAKLKKAVERVRSMLQGMHTGGDGTGGDMQESVCRWYNGKIALSHGLGKAELAFNDWLREKGLYGKRIGEYRIVRSKVKKGSDPVIVLMIIEIDAQDYLLKVPEGQPISWGK